MAITINAAGGNWSAGGTWVGGIAPTSSDDVDISALTGTLTINGTSGSPNLCRDFTTGTSTGTISHGSGTYLDCYGSFTIASNVTYNPVGDTSVLGLAASWLRFKATATGKTITSNGKRMPTMQFNGVGGGWTFQDNMDGAGTFDTTFTTISLLAGSLDTNGKTVGNTAGVAFSGSNSTTRSFTLGATTWNIPSYNSGLTLWNLATTTNLTFSGASSTIKSAGTYIYGTACVFEGGGLTYGTVTLPQRGQASAGNNFYIKGANTYANLTLSWGAASTYNPLSIDGWVLYANQTVTGTFTSTGTNNGILRNFIYSDTLGTARTINAAAVSITQSDFRDITGAGAASWDLSGATGGAGDCGGNSGITFAAPKNCYFKKTTAANWSAANWYTTSGGSTPISPDVPLAHDNAYIDSGSGTGTRTLTVDVPRIPSLDCAGASGSLTLARGQAQDAQGNFKLGSTLANHTGNYILTLRGRGTYQFSGGGINWPYNSAGAIVLNTGYNASNSYSLSGNLTMGASGTMTFTSGRFSPNGYALKMSNTTMEIFSTAGGGAGGGSILKSSIIHGLGAI